jgi:hypothetical protein
MFVSETIIPSAERQILSESRQFRQRKDKSCQHHDNSVSRKTTPVRITAIPSAERQILSESRQFRQRNHKSCRNYGNSVSGMANPVRITANLSAKPQIRQRNRKSVRIMILQTLKPLKQSKKRLFHRFCLFANRKAETTPEKPHF